MSWDTIYKVFLLAFAIALMLRYILPDGPSRRTIARLRAYNKALQKENQKLRVKNDKYNSDFLFAYGRAIAQQNQERLDKEVAAIDKFMPPP